MRKIIGLVALTVILLPCMGFSGAWSFRVGYFVPRAQSELWNIEFDNMNFMKRDFQNATFGLSYEYFLNREVSLVFGIDIYSQRRSGLYRDWVGYTIDNYDYAFPYSEYAGDFDLVHTFSTSIVPLQASFKLTPLGRRSGIIPYVGGGLSLYFWTVKLQGDMIDFNDAYVYTDPDLGDVDVYGVYFTDAREETKLAVGFNAFAGLMIPIGRRVALEAEFKYSYGKGRLTHAFKDFNDFDLGGYQVSLGINYWF
jgi:hypothetical protein